MNGWAAFWIMCAVYIVCEACLYSQGHETLLWKHKTPAEKAIQCAQAPSPECQAEERPRLRV